MSDFYQPSVSTYSSRAALKHLRTFSRLQKEVEIEYQKACQAMDELFEADDPIKPSTLWEVKLAQEEAREGRDRYLYTVASHAEILSDAFLREDEEERLP